MKLFIQSLFLLLMGPHVSFAGTTTSFIAPPGWKLKSQQKDLILWEQDQKSMTWTFGEVPEVRDINKDNFKTEITKSEKLRKTVNGIMGLSDWSIHTTDFEQIGAKKIISVKGSYNKNGEKYIFVEWEIYETNRVSNLRLEFLEKKPLSDSELLKIYNSLRTL
ncbi:MAG: hypothetical protein ACXVCP_14095 [Bdellovibrio sp.]